MSSTRILVPALMFLFALCACGRGVEHGASEPMWRVTLVDPGGRPIDLHVVDDEPAFVRLGPEGGGVTVLRVSFQRGESHVDLPEPPPGSRYEIRVPGYVPAVVEDDPQGRPFTLRPGYPVDVVWPEGGLIPAGHSVGLSVRWRGPGDLPDAHARNGLQCAGALAGDPGVERQPGLRNVVFDATRSSTIRIRVPWAGPYRLTWGHVRYTLKEAPGSYSFSSSGSYAPDDGVAFEVKDLDKPVRVVLPAD